MNYRYYCIDLTSTKRYQPLKKNKNPHVYDTSESFNSLCKMQGRTMPLSRHLQESPVAATFPAPPLRTRARAVGSDVGTRDTMAFRFSSRGRNRRVARSVSLSRTDVAMRGRNDS